MFRPLLAALALCLTATAPGEARQSSPGFTPDLEEAVAILILLSGEAVLVDEMMQEPAPFTLVELLAGRILGAPPSDDAATLAWAQGECGLVAQDGVRQTFECRIDLMSVTRAGVDAVGRRSELESLARLQFRLSGDTRTDASELNWAIEDDIVRVMFAG